jgi:hypothetical protein
MKRNIVVMNSIDHIEAMTRDVEDAAITALQENDGN